MQHRPNTLKINVEITAYLAFDRTSVEVALLFLVFQIQNHIFALEDAKLHPPEVELASALQ